MKLTTIAAGLVSRMKNREWGIEEVSRAKAPSEKGLRKAVGIIQNLQPGLAQDSSSPKRTSSSIFRSSLISRLSLSTLTLSLGLFSFLALPAVTSAASTVFDIKTSVTETGTPPFDTGNSGCTSANAADAGNDLSVSDNCVRVSDIVTYETKVSVNQDLQPGELLKLVLTTKDNDTKASTNGNGVDGGQEWTVIPPSCDPTTSTISTDKHTLTCYYNQTPIPQGTLLIVDIPAMVKSNVTPGSEVWFNVTADSTGGNGINTATDTMAPHTFVTAGFRFDIKKQFIDYQKDANNQIVYASGPNGEQGRIAIFNITGTGKKSVDISNSQLHLTDSFTTTGSSNNSLSNNIKLANWGGNLGCGLMGDSQTANMAGAFPFGKVGINASATQANSTTNTGTVTCSQASASSPISIDITGIDQSNRPTNMTDKSTIASSNKYVVSIYVRMWVPQTDVDNVWGYGNSPISIRNTIDYQTMPTGVGNIPNVVASYGEDVTNNIAGTSVAAVPSSVAGNGGNPQCYYDQSNWVHSSISDPQNGSYTSTNGNSSPDYPTGGKVWDDINTSIRCSSSGPNGYFDLNFNEDILPQVFGSCMKFEPSLIQFESYNGDGLPVGSLIGSRSHFRYIYIDRDGQYVAYDFYQLGGCILS